MLRRSYLAALLLALVLVGCGAGAQPQASGRAPLQAPLAGRMVALPLAQASSREQVSVAYLGPELAVALDVATGRLQLSGLALWFNQDRPWAGQQANQPLLSGVVGIEDPLAHHRLFRYVGGIPGLAPASVTAAGSLALPAPGNLPVWGAPRAVLRRGRVIAIVLPDGRRIGVSSDRSGRATAVSWSTPHGVPLHTTIRYAGSLTTITDPFGVTRTYERLTGGRAFEIVPAAWRSGPGYRHWIYPVLDDARETGWIQHRTSEQRPVVRDLLASLPGAAGAAFGGVSYDSPANGGDIDVGLTSPAAAGRVDSTLRRLGLLDVSAILPTLDTVAELRRAFDSLRAPLDPIARACHVSWGEGVDDIAITVADTITPAELAVLDHALRSLPAWAVIQRTGSSTCAIALTAVHGTRRSLRPAPSPPATAVAASLARRATRAAQVRISLPRSSLRAGQAVAVTIINRNSARILRGDCLILARRVDGRWETITRTHGVDVTCPALGVPQAARSRQSLTLPLFDDLAPGTYRVSLIYKPMPNGAVVRLSGRGQRVASTSVTVLAFRGGPMPQLSEARILTLAQTAAARGGDPNPTLIQHGEGTRFDANLVDSGDLVFDWRWSYLIAEKGHFVFTDASGPAGAQPLRGSVITLVVDASTGQVTDSGISDRYPRLAMLGSVITDLPASSHATPR